MTPDPLADLMARLAVQDRDALRELYDAAAGKLFAVTMRILGDRAEAEDALQEVFTRIWLRANRYDPTRARAMTWLIAIARNHAIDRLRARPERTRAIDEAIARVPDHGPGPEQQTVAAAEIRRIGDCIDTLEPERAAAIKGAYLDGLSYAQLAQRHEIPLNTVRTWLRRSLIKLRECLDR
ncbi:sigma-70 family RNA polymerase sigma factor [Acidimangrovimonas sediminis]|uniref:sigma-70 family RNA polymerase sigma factor n=1 Tax=Acidimangrovimonas sediminis TaxID=2056283 RepID=UPI000C80A23B|nr:sigma-70 family RNA polymerase sigma factor [Acidimangrovimonas sediminis]